MLSRLLPIRIMIAMFHRLFVIKSLRINMKFLTALLNSQLIAFWLRHKGKMQGHQFQVDKEPLLEIPIVKPKSEGAFTKHVDQILTVKRKTPMPTPPPLRREIEEMVYKLYDLTPEEIAIVEGKMINYPKGSEWLKWDLHVHTPSSALAHTLGSSWDIYVERLIDAAKTHQIATIATADYFTIEGYKKLLEYYNQVTHTISVNSKSVQLYLIRA